MNFNVQLFWKLENHLFWCFLSQLQYRNENQNFISNFISQFIKKTNLYFGYTDLDAFCAFKPKSKRLFVLRHSYKKHAFEIITQSMLNRIQTSSIYYTSLNFLWQSVYPKCHFVFLINWKTKFKILSLDLVFTSIWKTKFR